MPTTKMPRGKGATARKPVDRPADPPSAPLYADAPKRTRWQVASDYLFPVAIAVLAVLAILAIASAGGCTTLDRGAMNAHDEWTYRSWHAASHSDDLRHDR